MIQGETVKLVSDPPQRLCDACQAQPKRGTPREVRSFCRVGLSVFKHQAKHCNRGGYAESNQPPLLSKQGFVHKPRRD
jgi:hypothetical protein